MLEEKTIFLVRGAKCAVAQTHKNYHFFIVSVKIAS